MGTDTVRRVPIVSNALVADAATGRLFVSVPGTGGARANTITTIDPVSATLGASAPIGLEPNKMGISPEGGTIWVGLDGTAGLRRFDTRAGSAIGIERPVGSRDGQLFYAEDIEVMPGSPLTAAVSRRSLEFSPHHEGVAIYDNGVARSLRSDRFIRSNSIEFGASSATLYGIDQEGSPSTFNTMAVSSIGVRVTDAERDLIASPQADILYKNGLVYTTWGDAIDPIAQRIIGSFGVVGYAVEVDPVVGRAFFLTQVAGGVEIRVFDTSTFAHLGSIAVVPAGLLPTDLTRWGVNGLAFRTPNEVVVITSDLVPAPSGAGVLGIAGLVCGMRRRR